MMTKYLGSVFKSLVFGHHVINASKSQIMSNKSVDLTHYYPLNAARFENLPEFEGVFNFGEIKFLGIIENFSILYIFKTINKIRVLNCIF